VSGDELSPSSASSASGGSVDGALVVIVDEARRRGFVGAMPSVDAIEHARGFAAGVATPPARLLDLGSGGGLPGLVLAMLWTDADVTLVESSGRRCGFLLSAVERLGVQDRVTVIAGRAEEVGRRPELRGSFDVVTARGFGRPAVTAECAAPFLRVGGTLVVSEPPSAVEGDERWPVDGLELLGMAPGEAWTTPYHFRSLVQTASCPDRFPRRVGVPGKRPLF
jgi:16S rRNA (guanine527-N7)-methyltransferase